jgi:hypothetical protein
VIGDTGPPTAPPRPAIATRPPMCWPPPTPRSGSTDRRVDPRFPRSAAVDPRGRPGRAPKSDGFRPAAGRFAESLGCSAGFEPSVACAPHVGNLNVAVVRTLLQEAEPARRCSSRRRTLRRVVRLDRRLPGFGLAALNRRSYCLERDRLLSFVDRDKVELPRGSNCRGWSSSWPARKMTRSRKSIRRGRYCGGIERLLFRESVRVELLRRAMDAVIAGRMGRRAPRTASREHGIRRGPGGAASR